MRGATPARTPTVSPKMFAEVFAALLGVVFGLDPWKGWLYTAYYGSFRGGRAVAASCIAVMGGSALVTLLVLAPALYASYSHRYVSMLLAVYGANSVLQGALKLAYPRAHYYGSFRPGLGGLLGWSTINAAMSGCGLAVGCATLFERWAGAYYFVGYVVAFLVAASACFFRGTLLVRRLGFNFDPVLAATYVAVGAYSLLYVVWVAAGVHG